MSPSPKISPPLCELGHIFRQRISLTLWRVTTRRFSLDLAPVANDGLLLRGASRAARYASLFPSRNFPLLHFELSPDIGINRRAGRGNYPTRLTGGVSLAFKRTTISRYATDFVAGP